MKLKEWLEEAKQILSIEEAVDINDLQLEKAYNNRRRVIMWIILFMLLLVFLCFQLLQVKI